MFATSPRRSRDYRAEQQHKRNQGPSKWVYVGLVVLAIVAVIVVMYALDR